MKNYHLFFIFITGLFWVSCETNDPLKEMGTLGKQAANIYFVPLQPVAEAGTDIEYEVEYWTVGDEIKSQSLWDKIYLTEEYDIEIKNANYTYKNTIDSVYRDRTLYKEYDFDFTDWNPEKSAYDFKSTYHVDANFAKKTFKQNNTTKDKFLELISSQALQSIFNSLIKNKSILRTLVIDNSNAVDEATFNSWYDNNGKITEQGKVAAKNTLLSLDADDLLGDRYKKTEAYKIYLRFKVINGFDEENESSSRGFKVK